MTFIESGIIEIQFYSMLNIAIYPKFSNKTTWNSISFYVSIYILMSMVYKYLNIFTQVRKIIRKLPQKDRKIPNIPSIFLDIGFDGLKYSKFVRTPKTKKSDQNNKLDHKIDKNIVKHLLITTKLNMLFRIQLFVISMVLVSGQNLKMFVISALVTTQLIIVFYFIWARIKLKKSVFFSWVSFLSYFFLIAVISILSFVGFYLKEWHTDQWEEDHGMLDQNKEISN
jgi:hypothetical protein